MRGFGSPQRVFAIESHMDRIAEELGIDPVEFREKNAVDKGDLTGAGQILTSCGLKQCLGVVKSRLYWETGKKTIYKKGKITGLGIACGSHYTGAARSFLGGIHFDYSSSILKLNPDGTVNVITGECDIGQGWRTTASQIVSQVLDIPMSHIVVSRPNTATCPESLGTKASRLTLIGGNAVKAAAEDLRKRIMQIASKNLGVDTRRLSMKYGKVFVTGQPQKTLSMTEIYWLNCLDKKEPIIGLGYYDPPTVTPDLETGQGASCISQTFCVIGVEVEIDLETGNIEVIKCVEATDVGKAINPMAIEGQVHGGIQMGLGMALTEIMIVTEGRLVNPNLTDYKIIPATDMPKIETIILEGNEPNGPYGAKGCSEQTAADIAPAIANAIYNATRVRMKELPITPEKILECLKSLNRSNTSN